MAQGKGVGAKKKKQSGGSIKAKQGRTKKGLKKQVKSKKVRFYPLFFDNDFLDRPNPHEKHAEVSNEEYQQEYRGPGD